MTLSRRPSPTPLPDAGSALAATGAGRWQIAAGRVRLDAAARRLLGQSATSQPLEPWLARLGGTEADTVTRMLAEGGPLQLVLTAGPQRVLMSGRAARGSARGLVLALPAAAQPHDAFTAAISHELRTPLNAILGFNRLARGAAPAPVRSHLDNVEASARMMLRIVDDLLDLARLEAGKLSIDTDQPLDLPALVARVGRVAAGLRQAKPVALYALVDAACPAALRGDAGRIEQVLLNLVGNALKFTLRGRVVLEVRLRSQGEGRVTVRVAVSDTGVGIELDQLDRIGQPFERAAGAQPQRAAGTGLGLTVVRRLLQLHGAELHVASVAGGGTTCWFDLDLPVATGADMAALRPGWRVFTTDRRLAASVATQWRVHGHAVTAGDGPAEAWVVDASAPGAQAHAERCRHQGRRVLLTSAAPAEGAIALPLLADAAFSDTAATPATAADLAGLTVLVLEDNPLNRQLLGEQLAALGARVVMADDGPAARARVEREHFDIALLDVQLPGESGLQTAQRLRASRAGERLPLVFLSAHFGPEEQAVAQAVGALGWLTKPYEPAALLALLQRVPRAAPARAAARPLHPVPMARLRRIFSDTWPAQRRLLAGDAETLRRGVHSLRGSLALLDERDTLALARRIEEALIAGQPPQQLPLAELLARADAIAAG